MELRPSTIPRIERRYERERRARLEAEAIAEEALSVLYRKRAELVLLQQITMAANEARTPETAYRTALDLVCVHTGWPVGHVYLVTPQKELVSSAIWYLGDEARYQPFRSATETTHLSAGRGLPGRVYSTAKPAWIVDVNDDSDFPRRDKLADLPVRAGFAFPIMAGLEVVAVAEFFSPEAIEPDEHLLELVNHIGTQLGRVVERACAQNKLVHDALHDPLTGLPNRTLFIDRLDHALALMRRSPENNFAVFFIDIDRFKVVNDSLGHMSGDILLKAIAERLKSVFQSGDTLARFGGDEFALMIECVRQESDSLLVAENIHRQLANPFAIGGHEVFVTSSIGIAISHPAYQNAEDLLRDADSAMYRAKELGRSRHVVFDVGMHERAMKVLRLEGDMRRALERQEFYLQYQPIVSLETRALVGFEALVRWKHPERGIVSPAEFIPLAEETGLIVQLGQWVYRKACQEMQKWKTQIPQAEPLSISINLSSRQFTQPDLVEEVMSASMDTDLDFQYIKLEITESAVMSHGGAMQKLSQLKVLGTQLLIDDFGTGYSSLSYLHHFPVDGLKIDGSFVRRMARGNRDTELVRTILMLAKNLNMDVVAECIETNDQLELLKELGCAYGQGYFFSRPLDVDKAEAVVKGAVPWASKVDGAGKAEAGVT